MEVVVNYFVVGFFFYKFIGDPYYLLIRLKIENLCLGLIDFVKNEGIIGSVLDNYKQVGMEILM
jgi:hypothetical protein